MFCGIYCRAESEFLAKIYICPVAPIVCRKIRMALAMGDIWAVRQDKLDNNTTEDGLHSKAFLPPSQTDNTDAVEEKLQRELQDSRTREAELQKQNEQLEDILHLREKEAENFRQVLSKTEKQVLIDTIYYPGHSYLRDFQR
jgi:hypothetical protein